jgi:hypothetical protein
MVTTLTIMMIGVTKHVLQDSMILKLISAVTVAQLVLLALAYLLIVRAVTLTVTFLTSKETLVLVNANQVL